MHGKVVAATTSWLVSVRTTAPGTLAKRHIKLENVLLVVRKLTIAGVYNDT